MSDQVTLNSLQGLYGINAGYCVWMLKQVQHDMKQVQHDMKQVQHDMKQVQHDCSSMPELVTLTRHPERHPELVSGSLKG